MKGGRPSRVLPPLPGAPTSPSVYCVKEAWGRPSPLRYRPSAKSAAKLASFATLNGLRPPGALTVLQNPSVYSLGLLRYHAQVNTRSTFSRARLAISCAGRSSSKLSKAADRAPAFPVAPLSRPRHYR